MKNKKYQPTDGEGIERNNRNQTCSFMENTLLVSIAVRSDTHLPSVRQGLKISAICAISFVINQSFEITKLNSKM